MRVEYMLTIVNGNQYSIFFSLVFILLLILIFWYFIYGNNMINGSKKIGYMSNILCFAIRSIIGYESHKILGFTIGPILKPQKCARNTKLGYFPPSLPLSLPSSFSSQVIVWIVWYFKYFEYIRFWNHFSKKKCDSIHCHSSLPSLYNLSCYFSTDKSSPYPS